MVAKRLRQIGGVLLIALAVAGCGLSESSRAPGTPDRPSLGIENSTTLDVVLVVNGSRVAVVPPGLSPAVDPAFIPPLPWTAELRTQSGRLLTSLSVEAGDTASDVKADGTVEAKGVFARVDLSCGRLTIWAGDAIPSGPAPVRSAGEPGDCLP